MAFNNILLSLLLHLIPFSFFIQTIAESTTNGHSSSTASSEYELPTLFLDSIEYKIYYTNVSVGDPGQELQLRIDIVQDETWVMDSEYFITCDERYTSNKSNETALDNSHVDYDIAAENVCASQGIYNSSDSDTALYFTNDYQNSNDSNNVMLVSSQELNLIAVDGQMMEDHFHFLNESIKVSNVNFIAANYTNVLAGGLGLASGGVGSNFLQSLVNSNKINSTSYSLYLGRLYANDIELHLGGLDTSKIKGDFVEFDFIPYQNTDGSVGNNLPIVPLTGITVTSGGTGLSATVGDADFTIPALLDSRTYYSYLPYDSIIDLALQLNAYYSADLERWIVDCQVGQLYATVDFKFGNLTINIRLSELMYLAYSSDGTALTFQSSGASACFLSVLPQENEGFALLGTPFLRSVYLAVDNEGKKLAMANAYVPMYDSGRSITEILASDSSVSVESVRSASSLSAAAAAATKKKTTATTTTGKKELITTEQKDADATATNIILSSSLLSSSVDTTSTTKTWGSTKTQITSGSIPFAQQNNITSYEALTLTQLQVNSTKSPTTGNVVITNGEIVFTNSGDPSSTQINNGDGSNASNLYSSSYSAGAFITKAGYFNGLVMLILLFI